MSTHKQVATNRIFVGGIPIKMGESSCPLPRNTKGLFLNIWLGVIFQTGQKQEDERTSRIWLPRV